MVNGAPVGFTQGRNGLILKRQTDSGEGGEIQTDYIRVVGPYIRLVRLHPDRVEFEDVALVGMENGVRVVNPFPVRSAICPVAVLRSSQAVVVLDEPVLSVVAETVDVAYTHIEGQGQEIVVPLIRAKGSVIDGVFVKIHYAGYRAVLRFVAERKESPCALQPPREYSVYVGEHLYGADFLAHCRNGTRRLRVAYLGLQEISPRGGSRERNRVMGRGGGIAAECDIRNKVSAGPVVIQIPTNENASGQWRIGEGRGGDNTLAAADGRVGELHADGRGGDVQRYEQ